MISQRRDAYSSQPHRTQILAALRSCWQGIEEEVVAPNFARVLEAFRSSGLVSADLAGTTGYGYDDRGRVTLDRVVADIFGAERALVRSQWVSGTHVLAGVLRALLRPGDSLWIASGPVYDTLRPFLFSDHPAALTRLGVSVITVPTGPDGLPDWTGPHGPLPRVVYIQRSRGYQARPSWGFAEMAPIIEYAHGLGAVVVVDNCYGEFTTTGEPTHWGADLVAGSLMKNPGGGIAPTGAYIAGRADLCEQVADSFLAPGLGLDVGPTGAALRLIAQGWFMAPQAVGEALMGGAYAARLFAEAGYTVTPPPDCGLRNDIVTAIRLERPEAVEVFCRSVQSCSPIDATAVPEPWAMPGYHDPVIMAAGGFVSGGTLELSADAPMRSPYWVYLQGGLTRWHTVMAAEAALDALKTLESGPPPGR